MIKSAVCMNGNRKMLDFFKEQQKKKLFKKDRKVGLLYNM